MSNASTVPLWRQVLRGFSQCAFQANEVTGVLFLIAVAVSSWRMAAFYAIGVVVGTLAARRFKGSDDLGVLGLFGFNSGLVGLAMGNCFQPSPMLWVWVVVFAIVAAAVTVAMSKWVPVPFLAAPFILTFWAVWPVAGTLGLTEIAFDSFPAAPVAWGASVLAALGSALFVPMLLSGAIFLVGIAVSSWRHALVAALGGLVANALAAQAGVVGGAISFGFVGFNGVLAALAAYTVVAADLRLVVLAALLATWLVSYIHRSGLVPALASGFVLAIWVILFLAWLNQRFTATQTGPKAEPDTAARA